MTLAQLLRRGREAKGWTLRKAAQETGISNGYLSLIEQGRVRAPSPSYLLSLAKSYELSYAELMELAGHPSGPAESVRDRDPAPVSIRVGVDQLESAMYGARHTSALSESTVPPDAREGEDVQGTYACADAISADERELIALLAEDLDGLSLDDIEKVRAFIAGLSAGRSYPSDSR